MAGSTIRNCGIWSSCRSGPASTPLSERAIEAAGTRPILMVSGGVDRRKGLELIARLAGDQKFAEKILIVIAGTVAKSELGSGAGSRRERLYL